MSTSPLELQPSLVQKFIKSHLEEDLLISSNFKKTFSRCLTHFIFYLMTISQCSSKEKNKSTVTIDDLRKSLEEMDFEEEILKKMNSTVLEYKSKSKKKIKTDKKEQIEMEEINIDSEPENEVLSEKDDGMEEEENDDQNGLVEENKEDVIAEKNDDNLIDEGIAILEENND